MDYISVREASNRWQISERRVQKLCKCNRIEGVLRYGRSWMIPQDAKKPEDMRRKEIRDKVLAKEAKEAKEA